MRIFFVSLLKLYNIIISISVVSIYYLFIADLSIIVLFSCNTTPQAVALKSVVYNESNVMAWSLQSFRDLNLAVDFPKNI